MRIGQSTDIHPLVQGRPLILGGVTIESTVGALGHSDADALTHAIAESILGACALGDLGKHFPDTDPRYKGVSSLILLEACVDKMHESGYEIENIDALVLLEKPKLAPYMEAMKASLCSVLKIELNCLNLKATRGEGLGFIGRNEGVVAQAICLLRSK